MSLQSKTFADLVNFARASTATYVDADGLIKTAAVDAPRFDWSTGRRALLIEPSATNLINHSSNFAENYWVKQNAATISSHSGSAPDGSFAANRLSLSGASDNLYANISVTPGVPYTLSIWAKSISGDPNIFLKSYNSTDGERGAYAALSTDEWRRITLTLTFAAATTTYQIGRNVQYNLAQTVAIWGAQFDAGSTATSYIPTTGTAATRAADVASIKGLTAGTFDRRLVTPSGTADTPDIVHPGGDIALAPGAYYQSIYYPGGTL